MGNVIADPDSIILVDSSDEVKGWDPYRAATKTLYNINGFEGFRERFSKLEPRAQIDILSKIVEEMYE